MINLSETKNLKKLKWVCQALCTDRGRQEMCRLLIGPHLVATDGYRVHIAGLPELKDACPVTVPSPLSQVLYSMANQPEGQPPLWYSNGEKGFRLASDLESGSRVFTTHIQNGPYEFPDYQLLEGQIEQSETVASYILEVQELRRALRLHKYSIFCLEEILRTASIAESKSRSYTLYSSSENAYVTNTAKRTYIEPRFPLEAIKGWKGNARLTFKNYSNPPLLVIDNLKNDDFQKAIIMPIRGDQ